MKPEKLRERYDELKERFEILGDEFLWIQEDANQNKEDVLRLLAILVEKGIGIPEDIAGRHIHRLSSAGRPPLS